ncbi:transcription termination/antitermination protein NusA [Clostridium botulinum]|uniref:Transcription termination/antitermination protein NusA n=3 Tax=Clostridium botulinum TaxID=1491 RepID=A5I4J6_CLOBH|nr:transcription termination factor NusA [Clostridium botulinum]EPS48674.1 transcription elongation factor NusA [Clostridium botulinum CFSAN002367]EPS51318.1 transcription elongation factor NusA [Clostridium botulinum CFSAN002369]ABS35252.1 transcription termination factor NusA [Clostridium botulinum A str. ATCC 19397]ABS37607.1 N utilization substance protein A [Clostridium botulinum A str. Hall]ACA56676.1 N utilization substance protein A [Clostridium botulinum A3 str. Loch Maree]
MNQEFVEALREIVKEKGISADLLFTTIEDALVTAYKKNYAKQGGSTNNVKVIMNRENGEIKVYAQKKVVDFVEEEVEEISLEDAKEIDPNYELEDIINIEVTPKKFGRIAAQAAKQVVIQRIKEEERRIVYNEYIEKEEDILTGTVLRKDKGNILINVGKSEAVLGPNEQIPGEQFRFNEKIKLYVVEVKNTTKGPQVLISRTHPGLVKRLFELEVPEIYNGIVEIKSIAREAGSRTKIAVYSNDESVDPMGACVGPKGVRVQNIVNELKNEKIDIIKWSKFPDELICNALSPAKVIDVTIVDEENKAARAVVDDSQLSLAIGKEGQNVRLAAKLTGWKIDIKSKSQAEKEATLNLSEAKDEKILENKKEDKEDKIDLHEEMDSIVEDTKENIKEEISVSHDNQEVDSELEKAMEEVFNTEDKENKLEKDMNLFEDDNEKPSIDTEKAIEEIFKDEF